ncbi:MAG: hypothetical protein IT562_05425 [Alphaproteobacteria bacterium]|nr:hypothetical protein [Alphaproteobacteria bacterium]
MRTIQIDFDVHKLIEMERRGFDESPNSALRRLLKLPEADTVSKSSSTHTLSGSAGGQSWRGEGVVLEHGTKLRMSYGRPKATYQGTIINGEWVIGTQRFDSPSGAASAVAVTGKGRSTRLNGWTLWEVQRPDETTWTSIAKLRKEAAPLLQQQAGDLLRELGLLQTS